MNTATAVLLAVLACALAAAAAPQERQFSQQFLDEEYNRYRQQVPFYTNVPEEEPEELNFFQRLIRPWNWVSYIREYFSSSDEDEEEDYADVYDTFPGGAVYPGAQVARLDERPPAYHQQYRPQQYQQPQQQPQQQYRPRPIHNQYQAGGRVEAPYPQAPPQTQLGRSHPEEQEHADDVNLQQEQEYAGEQEPQPLV